MRANAKHPKVSKLSLVPTGLILGSWVLMAWEGRRFFDPAWKGEGAAPLVVFSLLILSFVLFSLIPLLPSFHLPFQSTFEDARKREEEKVRVTRGSRRTVTVFFSDIRGFTAISEKISPEEVVAMLNEYFTRMVGVIHESHGIVDKFIGDAIMAVWGASQGKGSDPALALKACLKMRLELSHLNQQRMARGEPPLLIGMGLHLGEVISGTIGSEERMEYTVIGDAVNIASRIEAATKTFGVDLLVSETLLAGTKDVFIVEEAGTAVMKGKSEPLKLFKVHGYYDEDGDPVLVTTPYAVYATGPGDKIRSVALPDRQVFA